jgi:hypothetical protein
MYKTEDLSKLTAYVHNIISLLLIPAEIVL